MFAPGHPVAYRDGRISRSSAFFQLEFLKYSYDISSFILQKIIAAEIFRNDYDQNYGWKSSWFAYRGVQFFIKSFEILWIERNVCFVVVICDIFGLSKKNLKENQEFLLFLCQEMTVCPYLLIDLIATCVIWRNIFYDLLI